MERKRSRYAESLFSMKEDIGMNSYIVGVVVLMLCVVIFAEVSFGEGARFKGGSYDGYDQNLVENTTVRSGIPAGTILKFGELKFGFALVSHEGHEEREEIQPQNWFVPAS